MCIRSLFIFRHTHRIIFLYKLFEQVNILIGFNLADSIYKDRLILSGDDQIFNYKKINRYRE